MQALGHRTLILAMIQTLNKMFISVTLVMLEILVMTLDTLPTCTQAVTTLISQKYTSL